MLSVAVLSIGVLGFAVWQSIAPRNFPRDIVVSIKEGATLTQVATMLEEKAIIHSSFVYKIFVVVLGGSKKIMAGDYRFESPISALRVAYRTIHGEQGIPKIKITIPEGMASYDMATLLADKIPGFDGRAFLKLAKPKEGKLFPDTYYFSETVTPEQVVTMMTENFDKQVKNLTVAIGMSGRSFNDVLKMASIIEREANNSHDRRVIAGILWKRIDSDHPLQVDQPFFYTLGKASSALTLNDLKSDSPYNLYMNKGLPPTPTSNPGLETIVDTLNPIASDYWFYLSDSQGKMHYANTHDGHIANKEKYIQ